MDKESVEKANALLAKIEMYKGLKMSLFGWGNPVIKRRQVVKNELSIFQKSSLANYEEETDIPADVRWAMHKYISHQINALNEELNEL